MKKSPPESPKGARKSTPARPNNPANRSRPGANRFEPEPEAAPLVITLQQKILAGLVLVVLFGAVIFLFLQPNDRTSKEELDKALGTAVASSGFTPPPSLEPGSELGITLVIFGLRDYIPQRSEEQINFVIVNQRFKSVYVSQCDGILLQRFLGTDFKDKKQTQDLANWESIAPGNIAYCGPAGAQAVQVEPGQRADASFKFDRKVRGGTRPFEGKSWDVPGIYRLLVQFYLTCPNNSVMAADCIDKHYGESDYFRLVKPDEQFITPAPNPPLPKPGPVLSPTP